MSFITKLFRKVFPKKEIHPDIKEFGKVVREEETQQLIRNLEVNRNELIEEVKKGKTKSK